MLLRGLFKLEFEEGRLLTLASSVYSPMQKGRVFIGFAFCPKGDRFDRVALYADAVRKRTLERSRRYPVALVLPYLPPSEMTLCRLDNFIREFGEYRVEVFHMPALSEALRQWSSSTLSSNEVSHAPKRVSVFSRWLAPRTAETE